MQSVENRMLQLVTKPKNRTFRKFSSASERWKKKSPKALPTARITASSQLNPDREKILNFSTNISDLKFGGTLDSTPLGFFSERQQFKWYFPWLDRMLLASWTLTATKYLDSQYPKTSRVILGRPLLLRMALSLLQRQIWMSHKNHRLYIHILTTLLIRNICDELSIRLWTKKWWFFRKWADFRILADHERSRGTLLDLLRIFRWSRFPAITAANSSDNFEPGFTHAERHGMR